MMFLRLHIHLVPLLSQNVTCFPDPDRPKNDKATILGDSVQVVKELRAEVKRLKCEQSSLLDESRDVSTYQFSPWGWLQQCKMLFLCRFFPGLCEPFNISHQKAGTTRCLCS